MNPFQESIDPITKKPVWSMRRVLSAYFAILSAVLFIIAFPYAKDSGWVVFIPGGISTVATVLLLFFTTWSDLKGIVAAARGLRLPGEHGGGSNASGSSLEDK